MNGLEDQFTFLEEKSDLKKQIFGEPEEIEKELGFTPLEEKSALPTPIEEPELPIEEAKPSILERIKGLARKTLPFIPGIQQQYMTEMAKETKKGMPERPEMPGIRALTPEEEERGLPIPEEVRRYPETSELEYGKFEKLLDIPGQFLTQFAKGFGWGVPALIPGVEPVPTSELSEVTGALGYLGGLAGAGAGKAAAFAPFKFAGKIASALWKKPAKSAAMKVVQNVVKNANTLGLALGASEWEGADAKEILRNKIDAFARGEAIGAFFGGMQFVNFSKASPTLSYVFRFGLGSALLDLAEGKKPYDERTLFNKMFDYGLNAYFLRTGISPKDFHARTNLLEEIKDFNEKARTEGFAVNLPEGLKEISKRVGRPKEWIMPGEEVPAKRIMPAVEPAAKETTINVNPLADGSVDVTIKTPRKAPRRGPVPKTSEKIVIEAMEQREGRYLPRARPEFKKPPRVKKTYPEEYIAEQNEMIKEAEGFQRRFEAGEDLTKLAEGLRDSEVTVGILEKYAPDVHRRAETIKRREHAKMTQEEFLMEEKKAEALEVSEEKLVEKEKAIREKVKIPKITSAMKEIEAALKKGKELTEAQKKALGEKYEYKPTEKAKPLPEPEIEKAPERVSLVNVSIKTPTGAMEDLGEIPEGRVAAIKEYAKKLGVGENLKTGTPYKGKWTQYLPPPEIEAFMKKMVRDVKEQPKEAWEKWEYYSGYPVTKVVKDAVNKIREKQKIRKRVKLEEIKEELQKTDEGKVEWMYIETEMKLKEKRAPTFKKAFEGAKRALVDTSGNVKKELIKNLGSLGKEAVIYHDVIAGADAKSQRMFDDAGKKIYKDISKADEALLNRAIQSRRIIAVLKYKPEHKTPHGLTAEQHKVRLKSMPEEIKKDRADLYFKEMEKVVDNLESEGLIDSETAGYLKSKGVYSPFEFIQYIDPESTGFDAKGRKISVPDSGIKALDEGSYNVMELNSRALLSQVLSRTQARISRNRANKAAFKIAKDLPDNGIFKLAKVERMTKEGKQVYQKAPAGHTKIAVMIEGKARDIIMPDKYAKEWVKSDPLISQTMATIIGWISGSKILKPMATGLNPGFALTNFPRDIFHVYLVSSEYSSFLPKFMFQIAKDLHATKKDAFLRKGAWIDYINEGGGMSFLTHQGRVLEKIPLLKDFEKVMGYLGETSEIWTRLALRKRAIRNGKSPQEATWEARNYLDFFQGGSVIKALDAGIPYVSAGVQGTRGIFRALGDRPVDTLWKFAQLGTLATGLYLANKHGNPECWDSVTDREKVNNFIITTPFNITDKSGNKRHFYLKVAKDQGQRIVCTLFENFMRKQAGEKVDPDQFLMALQDFLPIIPEQNIPPTLDALMGYAANRDFWVKEDIWKGEKRTPREEYTIYTHPALVKAGKITTLSPERLSYALSQVFTRGNIYTSLVSGGLSAIMNEMPEGDKRKTTAEMVQKIPMIRRVFRLTPPYNISEIKALKKAKIEETTRKGVQKRELKSLANEYYRKLKDEKVRDRSLLGEIKTFVKGQPKEDRKRLANWFKNYGIVYAIPDKSWWLNAAELTPEVRATMFWTKYLESDKEEKEGLKKLGRKIPGFWSPRFSTRLNILLVKWKREQ